MKIQTHDVALRVVSIAAFACVAAAPPVQPKAGEPLPGLSGQQRFQFNEGLEYYRTPLTAAQGLGPAFNQPSCVACHEVPVGGWGSTSVTRRWRGRGVWGGGSVGRCRRRSGDEVPEPVGLLAPRQEERRAQGWERDEQPDHHPRTCLTSSTLIDPRERWIAMMIARPTTTSAAATTF